MRHAAWICGAIAGGLLFTAFALPIVLDWLDKVRQISPARMSSALRFADRFHHALIESFLAVWVFAFGASLASFLNVVAYRLPRGQSILGRSRCPVCRQQLTFAENFPVLGWVTSLGRCRYCSVPIPARYVQIEVVLGLLVFGLYLVDVRSGLTPREMFSGEPSAAVGTALFRWGAHCLLASVCVTELLARWEGTALPNLAYGIAAGMYLIWGGLCRLLGSGEAPWSQEYLLGLVYGWVVGWLWERGPVADSPRFWSRAWGLAGWTLGAWLLPLAAILALATTRLTASVVQPRLPLLGRQVMQTLACLLSVMVLAPMVAPIFAAWPLAGSAVVLGLALVLICWFGRWQANEFGQATTAAWGLLLLTLLPNLVVAGPQDSAAGSAELKAQRVQFQNQEIIPNRTGGWIFAANAPPRLIWRDVDEVRRLGGAVDFRLRWFDADLNEHPTPQSSGRWIAWLEGVAPNGTPFRRAYTLYGLPEKIDFGGGPDLTVAFPNFPGPSAPATWGEHRAEIEKAGRDFVIRSFLDSERGAILVAGIAESQPLGRPCRYLESTTVANDDQHLRLKLKLQGHVVKPFHSPRLRSEPAPILREDSAAAAGVPSTAAERIDTFCREWQAATGVPFVTLVSRRGVIVLHKAYGQTSTGEPLPLDYRCWIASLTKTVTAVVFSQFVDQGLIQLDAPLSSVFPDYPGGDRHVPTFRQCLNHTSGLSGHGEWGGMHNPHLENIVLNGIDVVEPGAAHVYCGLGFELVAKAMELVAGKSAARVYHDHLFQPLGFGDVVLGNASSDAELTAWELATLGQWICNQGSYGDQEFIAPATFAEFLPRALSVPGASLEQGLGLHAVYHRKPGADPNSKRPEDLLFSPQTVGHGSFSGCILVVDPEQQLVIAQARREFKPADNEWYPRFFQTIAAALEAAEARSGD